MVTMVFSFIIPLLTITVQQQDTYPAIIKQVVYVNQLQTIAEPVIITTATESVREPLTWMDVLKVLYVLSVTALSARLIFIVARFLTKMRNKKRTSIGGVKIVRGDKTLNNGSFFNYIFLNGDELTADEMQQIIAHEMLHVKLYHSVDRLLVKVAQIFLWFNPFVYLYARAIEQNHEFEVDREVGNSTDKNKYAELLLHLSVASGGTLYHNFSMVPLKKRITMLFTKPTHKMKKVIYLLVVPVVLISCLAFAKLKSNEVKNEKVKVEEPDLTGTDTGKVNYRQKSKLTPAQRKANNNNREKALAYLESAEGKKKMEQANAVQGKEIIVTVLSDYKNEKNLFKGKIVKDNTTGAEFLLPSWYGQSKQLNTQIKQGDELTINVFSGGVNQESPVMIMPAYVVKNGKKIFQLAEAEKIPDYPFLYEANKVRFAEGQISNITKYPNGKWKTAVFERVNGYKFYLSFKPNAPDLNSIKWGDHVTLRFVHEVKTGPKTYDIADWVAISPDIKDYGIKNPDFFFKFYERSNDDSRIQLNDQRSGSVIKAPAKITVTTNPPEAVAAKTVLPDLPSIKHTDSVVTAKFGGKVHNIRDILGTKLVIIRNGDYFAAYANLWDLRVSKGDDIRDGQILGKAGIDTDNNIVWDFLLFQQQHMIENKTEQQAIINSLASPKVNYRLKNTNSMLNLASR